MNALICARCILERYNIQHTEPVLLTVPEFQVKPAMVLYEGTSLCGEHLIGHVNRNAAMLAAMTD